MPLVVCLVSGCANTFLSYLYDEHTSYCEAHRYHEEKYLRFHNRVQCLTHPCTTCEMDTKSDQIREWRLDAILMKERWEREIRRHNETQAKLAAYEELGTVESLMKMQDEHAILVHCEELGLD